MRFKAISVYPLPVFVTTALILAMAGKRSLTNLDSYERYVKVFNVGVDAARLFVAE